MRVSERILFMVFTGQVPQTVLEAFTLFFALAIGHAFADFPLQSRYLATHKNRHYQPATGEKYVPGLWVHCMAAHSMIHSGFVWIITGHVGLAVIEAGLHFTIDSLKCEGKIGFHADQLLHYSCKAGYVIILYNGWLA